MGRVASIAVLLVLLSPPAWAYKIKAQPAEADIISRHLEIIPPCTWEHIAHHFKTVKVLAHGKLGEKKIDGVTYYIQADTWFKAGLTFLDQKHVDSPNTILHEMGHWYYLDVTGKDYKLAWQRAVDVDFALMDKDDSEYNAYLKDPEEAFAELFAANMLKDEYYKHPYYEPDDMPHSEALLAEILEKTCPPAN